MGKEKLFVWADRVKSKPPLPLDHTWVSSYTPNVSNPSHSKGDYWYCWGDARGKAMLIGEGVGGRIFAKSIAMPHDKKSNVGIEFKKDGVCHQMANRLLKFCFDENKNPLTVRGAKGYYLSKAMYGTYGEKSQRTSAQRARFKKWEKAVQDYEHNSSGSN